MIMFNKNKKEINPKSCAEIAKYIALECYGVVGMATPNGVTLISQILPIFLNRRGVEVISTKKGYRINLYIITEFGSALNAVCKNLCKILKYKLENNYNISTDGINIYVKGVRKSSKLWQKI